MTHIYEKFYFTPGDLGLSRLIHRLENWGCLSVGDQWYPEAFRVYGFKGAELVDISHGIGWVRRWMLRGEKERPLS